MTIATLPQNLGDPGAFRAGVQHIRENDKKIGRLVERHGILEYRPGGEMFESLVESILSQQLASAAASSIIARVRSLYSAGSLEADALYRTPVEKLRRAGVSPQKIRYLKDLSGRVVKGRLDLEALRAKPDQDLIEALDDVLGIGPWTVQMLLIFTLGRPDVLPVDDLGIRKAVQSVYSLRELPKRERIEEIAERWHPYCTVASLYLWKHKDST